MQIKIGDKLIEPKNDTEKLVAMCAQLADDKLATDVFVLDLRKLESSPADFFMIGSCDSPIQVKAIVDVILDNVAEYRLLKPKVEGYEASEWALIDFFDVVAHLMIKNLRSFYQIEKLWGDADFYRIDDEGNLHSVPPSEVLSIYENFVGKEL